MTGKQLRDFRRGVELTQAQLAALLGVTGNTLARWERGEMAPPGHLLPLALTALFPSAVKAFCGRERKCTR